MAINITSSLRRRDFLAASAATAVAAAIPAAADAAQAPADVEWRNKQSGMTYRRLGRTGFMVSAMGMGGDDIRPDNNDFVLWAVDHGLNYFDTAPQYGRGASERGYAAVHKARGREKLFQVSKVNIFGARSRDYQTIFNSLPASEQNEIRKGVVEEVERRDLENPDYMGNFFTGQARGLRDSIAARLIAEKNGRKYDEKQDYKKVILDSVEASLKALGTDYLDCVLMRDATTPYDILNFPEIFEAFAILKKQGKARHLGFSAHTDSAGVLEAAIESGHYEMGMFAYNFLNHERVDPVLEKAKKADFGTLAMKASRAIQNPFNRRQTIPARVKVLEGMVPGEMTTFQKGFHYALQNPNLSGVVAGISDMSMAEEDVPLAFEKKA